MYLNYTEAVGNYFYIICDAQVKTQIDSNISSFILREIFFLSQRNTYTELWFRSIPNTNIFFLKKKKIKFFHRKFSLSCKI